MKPIQFIDRKSGQICLEQVYGGWLLHLFYGPKPSQKFLHHFILPSIAKNSLCSRFYGWLQKRPSSRKNILPFIKKYKIDISEFQKKPDHFRSFNTFFTRKLKPEVRPFSEDPKVVISPADGRHLIIPNIATTEGFFVKGQKFDLPKFLGDQALAEKYKEGAMIISRLCPTDYHRFHFPCSGKIEKPRLINGSLYSVNPIALKQNLCYIWENKRYITEIKNQYLGTVLFIEIGATNVGSIYHTSLPDSHYSKGDEKGYFSFGGSCIVMIFEKGSIAFDPELIEYSKTHLETYIQFGEQIGRATAPDKSGMTLADVL